MTLLLLIGQFLRRHFAARRTASLHGLDARTLHDIGVDASEIASIEAESRGQSRVTRLRIVAGMHHA